MLLQSQFQPNVLAAELLENLKDEKYLFHKNGHSWNSHITWAQDRNIPVPLLLQDRFPQTFKHITSAPTSTNSDT
jgi:predicted Rossmann fold nucleotide-binding protein DprA/Smf involved in DNA uptake